MSDGPAHPAPGGDDSQSGWHLAQCKSGQEHIAAGQLTQRGAALVFLPREPRNRRWRGRIQTLLAPVFPGYIFLQPQGGRPDWRAIRATRGLTRLVGFGTEGPATVPEAVVQALRERCDPDGVLRPPTDLRPGDRVRLLAGAFADLVATIETVAPNARIGLLLDLMGRQTRITATDPALLTRAT